MHSHERVSASVRLLIVSLPADHDLHPLLPVSYHREKEIGARPQLILHGRKVPWMLQHHNRLLTRSNRRHLRLMQHCLVPTYRWKGEID